MICSRIYHRKTVSGIRLSCEEAELAYKNNPLCSRYNRHIIISSIDINIYQGKVNLTEVPDETIKKHS